MPLARHALALPLLLLTCLTSATAADGTAATLVEQLNQFRESARECDGESHPPGGPLAPDARLAEVDLTRDTPLRKAVRDTGYRAREMTVIQVLGPRNVDAAMQAFRESYCDVLLDRKYSDVGVSTRGDRWQLVLAQPLLSPDLGDWQQAGRAVLERVNEARAEPRSCGSRDFDAAPPLSWNPQLAEAALAHSRDMAERDYFDHASPDGERIAARVERAGYRWRRIGENIAAGVGSAEQAVSGWLASPPHCANLMNPGFTDMGAAYAVNTNSTAMSYWTQVFGAPRKQAAE